MKLGFILNAQLDSFRSIGAALSKHEDLQLVLSVGDQVDPEQIGPVSNNAIIVKQAPQLELLKRASVCITHAGLNTVLESLAQGVPQVAIPVTFDQPGVAARIAKKQTGRRRQRVRPELLFFPNHVRHEGRGHRQNLNKTIYCEEYV